MPLFGVGKKTKPEEQQKGPPTHLVLQMRQQGMSNNQIVQNLQRAGHSTTDIFDAMNQADIKSGVEGAPVEGFDPEAVENPMRFNPQGGSTMDANMPPPPMPPPAHHAAPQTDVNDQVEEMVEAIIDERWTELAANINKVIEWKNKMETVLSQMEARMDDLEKNFNDLHKGVLGKIGEYDQNIVNVGTEVKAMEHAFQKVLPVFAENVKELSRIADTMKGSTKKTK